MADAKTTPTTTPKPSNTPATPETEAARGTDAQGTVQREPKPEDYPAAAKVTPPAEQLNSTLSQAVGTADDTDLGALVGDATTEAAEIAKEARDKTDDEFARRAKAEDAA